jgi:hypothetical protein
MQNQRRRRLLGRKVYRRPAAHAKFGFCSSAHGLFPESRVQPELLAMTTSSAIDH